MKIYASLLSSDTANFVDYINKIKCDGIHIDIMEYDVVSGYGFTPLIIPLLRKSTDKPIQAHIMGRNIDSMIEAKPDTLFFHPCWCENPVDTARTLRANNIQVGIVWNDDDASDFFYLADEIMFMTVKPGKGGQPIIRERIEKIKNIVPSDKQCWIDGGVNKSTLSLFKDVKLYGAVVGSAIKEF